MEAGDGLPLEFRRRIWQHLKQRNPRGERPRKTQEFKDLRAKAREAIAAFEDGADFDFTIDRLAAIGEKMNILLG